MREQDSQSDSHREVQLLLTDADGAFSPEKKKAVEDHCLGCSVCRTQLTVLLHLNATFENEDELRDLKALFTIGRQAAARARQLVRQEESGGQHSTLLSTASGVRLRWLYTNLKPGWNTFWERILLTCQSVAKRPSE